MGIQTLIGRTGLAAAAFLGATLALAPAHAQQAIKFSLDFKFEGPSAPFLVAIDKGYFKAEGLDVTIDSAAGSLEPINRVASGTYDMGFGDINSLIKFRDANPNNPIKAVFMVYNKPAFSIVGRKSRGVTKPKDLEGKKLGAPAPDGAYAQWKIFTQANGIDASKVTVENVGFPVREPMLAAGQVDAITGFSFSSFINLKDRDGIPLNGMPLPLKTATTETPLEHELIMARRAASPSNAAPYPTLVGTAITGHETRPPTTLASVTTCVTGGFQKPDQKPKRGRSIAVFSP